MTGGEGLWATAMAMAMALTMAMAIKGERLSALNSPSLQMHGWCGICDRIRDATFDSK